MNLPTTTHPIPKASNNDVLSVPVTGRASF